MQLLRLNEWIQIAVVLYSFRNVLAKADLQWILELMFSYKEEDLFLFPFYDHQQNQKQFDSKAVKKRQQNNMKWAIQAYGINF